MNSPKNPCAMSVFVPPATHVRAAANAVSATRIVIPVRASNALKGGRKRKHKNGRTSINNVAGTRIFFQINSLSVSAQYHKRGASLAATITGWQLSELIIENVQQQRSAKRVVFAGMLLILLFGLITTLTYLLLKFQHFRWIVTFFSKRPSGPVAIRTRFLLQQAKPVRSEPDPATRSCSKRIMGDSVVMSQNELPSIRASPVGGNAAR